jgi:hypothetical protein
MNESEMRDLLRWVYLQTREALFTKGNGKIAAAKRDAVLSEINKRLAEFRH